MQSHGDSSAPHGMHDSLHTEHRAPPHLMHPATCPSSQHAVGSSRTHTHGDLFDRFGSRQSSQRMPAQSSQHVYWPPFAPQHLLGQVSCRPMAPAKPATQNRRRVRWWHPGGPQMEREGVPPCMPVDSSAVPLISLDLLAATRWPDLPTDHRDIVRRGSDGYEKSRDAPFLCGADVADSIRVHPAHWFHTDKRRTHMRVVATLPVPHDRAAPLAESPRACAGPSPSNERC